MKSEICRTALLIGEDGAMKLEKSHVCVFGLGGVGSYTVEALARAGVGGLTLIDGDSVSLSNINRQLYALHSTVGMMKTDVARDRVHDINPDCEVRIITDYITPDNADSFFTEKYDFTVDAIDDTKAKTAIAVKCAERGIDLIASMGTGRKLRSDDFRIEDIYSTVNCPLCRVMRRNYKLAGLKKVTVLFSPEMPHDNKTELPQSETDGKKIPSSISFVPSAAGLRIAEYVISGLINAE